MGTPLHTAKLCQMVSGHLCLEFAEPVTWDSFPEFAACIITRIKATVIERADAVEMRIWSLDLSGVHLRLVYEDYPSQASLESTSVEADECLRRIATQLAPPDSPPSAPRG
jgi:Protein of unknown function (DUF3630)